MPDQQTIVAAIVTSPQACYWPDAMTASRSGPVIALDQIGERTHPKTGRHIVYIAADPVNGTAVRVGDPDEHSEAGWYPWATAEGMLPHLFAPVADHLRAALPS